MNVSRYMQRDAVTALPTATVSTVRTVMDEHGFGLLLVAEEGGKLVGFVTRASLKSVSDEETPMSTVAHAAKFAVSPDDTLEKAALILLENRLVLVPVVDGEGVLVGVLTQTEVLRGLTQGLGVGCEATRLRVRALGADDGIYDVLQVLRDHGAKLISLAGSDAAGCDKSETIIRFQGVEDREALRAEIERRLLEKTAQAAETS